MFIGAFFFLPQNLPQIHIQPSLPVVIDIFLHLTEIVGLSFFLLCTVSVSLQSWMSHTRSFHKKDVYFLYGASNLGSLMALVMYPFYIESHYTLEEQLDLWRMGFSLLIGLIASLLVLTKCYHSEEITEVGPPIPKSQAFRWMVLGSLGTIFFLSSTNIVTQEIAPIPLLWVIPLGIYLLTFIVVFRSKPFNPSWLQKNIHVVLWVGIFLFLFCPYAALIGMGIYAVILFVFLFLICVFVNNELYASRPSHKENLTFFYVMLSLGGFFGGILVSWIIPLISVDFTEFVIGIAILTAVLMLQAKDSKRKDFLLRLLMFATIIFFKGCQPLLMVVEIVIFYWCWRLMVHKINWIYGSILLASFLYTSLPQIQQSLAGKSYIYQQRNYYGIIRILEKEDVRLMIHGSTIHGGQYRDPQRHDETITYYKPSSPIGEIMNTNPLHLSHIAVIGLGAGSLAAYTDRDQSMDFYELDPDVYKAASTYFTFLHHAKGKIEHIFGDARRSLSHSTKRYDAIIVDAFGGDAIPVHLITVEAIGQYRQHLTKDGVLLFHFSNSYLDLLPVIAKNAEAHQAYCVKKDSAEDSKNYGSSSNWAILTWSQDKAETVKSMGWEIVAAQDIQNVKPWSDQYSNILPYLQLNLLKFPWRRT